MPARRLPVAACATVRVAASRGLLTPRDVGGTLIGGDVATLEPAPAPWPTDRLGLGDAPGRAGFPADGPGALKPVPNRQLARLEYG